MSKAELIYSVIIDRFLEGRKKLEEIKKIVTDQTSVSEFNASVFSTPLIIAAAHRGLADVVEYLYERNNAVIHDTVENSKINIVHKSLEHPAILKWACAKGADINLGDKNTEVPLYIALEGKGIKSAKILMAYNANPSIASIQEHTKGEIPLHETIRQMRTKISERKIEEVRQYKHLAYVQLASGADLKFTPKKAEAKKNYQTPLELLKGTPFEAEFLQEAKSGNSVAHCVARSGDVEWAELILAAGKVPFDIKARNKAGQTPLHLAVLAGHKAMARWLVEHGADLTKKDKAGQTPLDMATDPAFKALLQQSLSKPDKEEQQALREQAKAAKAQATLRQAQQQHDTALRAKQTRHQEKLLLAVLTGDLKQVQQHVFHPSFMEATDPEGNTPLHLAAAHGYTEIVQFFCNQHADVEAINKAGQTAVAKALLYVGETHPVMAVLEQALQKKQQAAQAAETAFYIQEGARKRNEALLAAARAGKGEEVRQWLAEGAALEAVTKEGETLWHLLAGSGALETLQALYEEHGSKYLEARTTEGRTPLHYAAAGNQLLVAKWLLACGVKDLVYDKHYSLPLELAPKESATAQFLLGIKQFNDQKASIAEDIIQAVLKGMGTDKKGIITPLLGLCPIGEAKMEPTAQALLSRMINAITAHTGVLQAVQEEASLNGFIYALASSLKPHFNPATLRKKDSYYQVEMRLPEKELKKDGNAVMLSLWQAVREFHLQLMPEAIVKYVITSEAPSAPPLSEQPSRRTSGEFDRFTPSAPPLTPGGSALPSRQTSRRNSLEETVKAITAEGPKEASLRRATVSGQRTEEKKEEGRSNYW